jgi:hypothetical protein
MVKVAGLKSLPRTPLYVINLDLASPFLLTCKDRDLTSGETSTHTFASRNSTGPSMGPEMIRGCVIEISELNKTKQSVKKRDCIIKKLPAQVKA